MEMSQSKVPLQLEIVNVKYAPRTDSPGSTKRRRVRRDTWYRCTWVGGVGDGGADVSDATEERDWQEKVSR